MKLCQNKEITRKDFVRHVRTFCPSRTDSASVPYGLYFPRYIFILTQPQLKVENKTDILHTCFLAQKWAQKQ